MRCYFTWFILHTFSIIFYERIFFSVNCEKAKLFGNRFQKEGRKTTNQAVLCSRFFCIKRKVWVNLNKNKQTKKYDGLTPKSILYFTMFKHRWNKAAQHIQSTEISISFYLIMWEQCYCTHKPVSLKGKKPFSFLNVKGKSCAFSTTLSWFLCKSSMCYWAYLD